MANIIETLQNFNPFAKGKDKQPLSNTTLLLTITICTFVGMYLLAMLIWGGGFLNPQQFLDLFNNNAYLIVTACGLTIVMITGGIDISVGGSVALITMASVVFMEDHNGGILSSIMIALGIGLAMGVIQGYFTAYLKIQPFIVTLAGMFFTRGMTTIVSKVPRTAENELFLDLKDFEIDLPFIGTYAKNGNWIPSSIELGVVIALIVVLILWAMPALAEICTQWAATQKARSCSESMYSAHSSSLTFCVVCSPELRASSTSCTLEPETPRTQPEPKCRQSHRQSSEAHC